MNTHKHIASVLVLLVAAALASCDAQNNASISVPVPQPLEQEALTCPLRDQINWLNQLLAIEYISQSYFTALNNNFYQVNSSLLTANRFADNVDNVKANVTLIVNQLNEVVSWLNTTVNDYCGQLPAGSEDRRECYSYVSCNYTFANLTSNWPTSATTPVPATNQSSNTTTPPAASNNNANLTNAVQRAIGQGADFSDRDTQFIISVLPLFPNSTLQQQLALFAVLHGQHASYLHAMVHQEEIPAPMMLSDSRTIQRTAVRNSFLPHITERECCDGFRGLRQV